MDNNDPQFQNTLARRSLALPATALFAAALALGGCAGMSETQKGTATGAGIGTVAGAVLGGAISGTGRGTRGGAMVGAAAGALGGYVWSRHMEQQRQAMEQATRGTGIGVSQTAYPFFFSLAGVPTDHALAVSILMQAIMLLGSVPGGFVWLLGRRAARSQT